MATTTMAAKPPARVATTSASLALRLAAPATLTLARTLTHMPTYPDAADASAPVQNEKVVSIAKVCWPMPASTCSLVSALAL